MSHRQFQAGGVNVCQLPALGSVCLARLACLAMCDRAAVVAAFCWSRCEADGGETTESSHPLLLLGPAPPVQALLSSLLNTQFASTLWRDHGHPSSKGQAMTRETVMSQTAHCWHLSWYFWLIATSLKNTSEKMFARHFSLLVSVPA